MKVFNIVLVQGNKNFKRSIVCSYAIADLRDAEKIAKAKAARLQYDEDDRCGGSSSNYFLVEEKILA